MASTSRFADLKCLSKETLAVLHAQGFTRATPVQQAVIPLFCTSKDVAVDAATGSGKTLAFVIPVAERLRAQAALEPPKPLEVMALLISPTRELAVQIHAVAAPFIASAPGSHLAGLIGGTDVAADVARVRHGATCVVGTPGRICDVLTRAEELSFARFEMLVLDEADRLLDMGFQAQLDAIMGRLPRQRRTGLFSATQTDAVAKLVRAGLRNPYRVNVAVSDGAGATSQKTPSSLTIEYLVVPTDQKIAQLLAFLSAHAGEKSVVYALTCASVEWLAAVLPKLPGGDAVPLFALHGNMRQQNRTEVLANFTKERAAALLCTDVAARGLDIPDIGHIFQLDAPQNPANFVHRCGRTARMGRSGHALAVLTPHEDAYATLLANRNVPLRERPPLDAPPGVPEATRRLAEGDRDVMEKGTRAFVSYVRGYKEHQCKFIFELSELDINQLGRMFGLLRLPVMKEVRKNRKGLSEFQQSEVDPAAVPYADRARERARQKALRKAAAAPAQGAEAGKRGKAACKHAKQKAAAVAEQQCAQEKKLPAAKRQLHQAREDREDLDDDYRLLRRLKKGKVSSAEYDRSIGLAE